MTPRQPEPKPHDPAPTIERPPEPIPEPLRDPDPSPPVKAPPSKKPPEPVPEKPEGTGG